MILEAPHPFLPVVSRLHGHHTGPARVPGIHQLLEISSSERQDSTFPVLLLGHGSVLLHHRCGRVSVPVSASLRATFARGAEKWSLRFNAGKQDVFGSGDILA